MARSGEPASSGGPLETWIICELLGASPTVF